jgi:hypothetical protein
MASRKAAPTHKDTADQDDEVEVIGANDLLNDPALGRAPSAHIDIDDSELLETRPGEILADMICAWRSAQEAREVHPDVTKYFLQDFAWNLARDFSIDVAEYLDQFPDKYRVAVAQIVVEAFFRERLLSMLDSDEADDE